MHLRNFPQHEGGLPRSVALGCACVSLASGSVVSFTTGGEQDRLARIAGARRHVRLVVETASDTLMLVTGRPPCTFTPRSASEPAWGQTMSLSLCKPAHALQTKDSCIHDLWRVVVSNRPSHTVTKETAAACMVCTSDIK